MSAIMANRIERLVVLVQNVCFLTSAVLLGNGEREICAVQKLDEVSGSVLYEYGVLLDVQGDAFLDDLPQQSKSRLFLHVW